MENFPSESSPLSKIQTRRKITRERVRKIEKELSKCTRYFRFATRDLSFEKGVQIVPNERYSILKIHF